MENEYFSMYDGRYSKGGFLCAQSGKDRHCLLNRDAVLLSCSGKAAVSAKEKAARRNEYGRGDGNGLPVVAAPTGSVDRKYSFCNLSSAAPTDGIF